MKKLISILLITGVLAGSSQAHKDSADSIILTTDSADKKHSASFGQEISGDDATFAVKAAAGGLAEVKLGKLAQQKGSSAAIKDYATMMVKDHGASNTKLDTTCEKQAYRAI